MKPTINFPELFAFLDAWKAKEEAARDALGLLQVFEREKHFVRIEAIQKMKLMIIDCFLTNPEK